MKKILNISFFFSAVAYLFIAFGFTAERNKAVLCKELKITLADSISSGFYKKVDIEKIILGSDSKVLGYPLFEINTREIESRLRKEPYLLSAEIFYNVEGSLYVRIQQRKPVLRIITYVGNTYYLDKEGYILPERGNFVPHILVANGYFSDDKSLKNISNIKNIIDKKRYSEWYDALELANFINQDEFWNAQIVQLYLNRNQDLELIPRVGAHQIILGSAEDFQEKFKKLKTLYNEGLKYQGWNNYEKINLKYTNQVICTKR
jgi:cell division protein FtsQ